MSDQSGTLVKRAVQNEGMIIISRYIMPTVVTLSLGIAAWSFNRLVITIDKQEERQDATANQVKDTTNEIRNLKDTLEIRARSREGQISDIYKRVEDHEGRLRTIERSTRQGPN